MLAIRYLTLAALVVWLGGLVTLGWLVVPSPEALRQFQMVGYTCGAIIFVSLLVLKFVGPPPRDFFPRIGLVAAMLLVALYSGMRPQDSPASPTSLTSLGSMAVVALGFVLLFWHVRE